MGDRQDIRSLGGAVECAPLTSFYFIGCSLALCGFPYMSGFYSRDLILEIFMIRRLNWLQFSLIILATVFTISYSLRLFFIIVSRPGLLGVIVGVIEGWERLGPMRLLFMSAVVRGSLIG